MEIKSKKMSDDISCAINLSDEELFDQAMRDKGPNIPWTEVQRKLGLTDE